MGAKDQLLRAPSAGRRNSTRVDEGRKSWSFLSIIMQGTNRAGEGEKSLLCDPGSELRVGESRKGKSKIINGGKKREVCGGKTTHTCTMIRLVLASIPRTLFSLLTSSQPISIIYSRRRSQDRLKWFWRGIIANQKKQRQSVHQQNKTANIKIQPAYYRIKYDTSYKWFVARHQTGIEEILYVRIKKLKRTRRQTLHKRLLHQDIAARCSCPRIPAGAALPTLASPRPIIATG